MDVEFVAEVSSNHNKDLDRCVKFIDTASNIGCDTVKFQLFRVSELFAPEILKKRKELQKRAEWELPLEFIPVLSESCRTRKIKFSCAPFYIEAVQQLRPHVNFYKIASYELLWHDLLRRCSQTELPIVLSTGMATLDEIDTAVDTIKSSGGTSITLLHCLSSYPALPQQCNLAAIKTLQDRYGCQVGWSDHSVKDSVIYRAVYKWNASMIEFHLDIDGKGKEYEIGHCWLPETIADVINNIRNGKGENKSDISADGNGIKEPVESEMHERSWRADPSDGLRPLLKMRKSVVEQ